MYIIPHECPDLKNKQEFLLCLTFPVEYVRMDFPLQCCYWNTPQKKWYSSNNTSRKKVFSSENTEVQKQTRIFWMLEINTASSCPSWGQLGSESEVWNKTLIQILHSARGEHNAWGTEMTWLVLLAYHAGNYVIVFLMLAVQYEST